MSQRVNIKYDEYIKSGENAWQVKIADQYCCFPYSLCDIDTISEVILCPMWLVIKKELEDYIDE